MPSALSSPIHGRRSIRLQNYDYRRDGAYFVTICTHERTPTFGSVVDGQMRLSQAGEITRNCWSEIPAHFPRVVLDQFVVMPDHMHGIIVIRSGLGGPDSRTGVSIPRRFGGALQDSLGTIIGVFKSYVTKRVMAIAKMRRVWQRNYYETIIRNERHLNAIRQYIISNPKRWRTDINRNTFGHGGMPVHRNM